MARQIQMLRAIHAFESAARNESYVGAARELSVTPAAVGQQVRALEEWLGLPLFQRARSGSQRLQPTAEAQAVLADIGAGLDLLDRALRQLRQRRARSTITVTASQAFVARWLLPRLEQFTAQHPGVDVRLDVSDRLVDLAHGEADLAIRCGAGRWPGVQATELMPEEVFPVASPRLLDRMGRPQSAQALLDFPLIHDQLQNQTRVFPSWAEWLGAQGIALNAPLPGVQINASGSVIQSALHGQGLALARRAFVQDELEAGTLVRLLPEIRWPVRWRYYLVMAEHQAERAPVAAFVRWIHDACRASAPG
jgi:LysR family glycine cleavage system transcriptional activator